MATNEEQKVYDDMERLFLIEFMVDKVHIDYCKLDLDKDILPCLKQACVRFQFLNYPVLEICEEDFCQAGGDYLKEDIEFKSGRSCLFSLRGIPPDIRSFDVCVTVLRQMEGSSCVTLGKTNISLGSSFSNILATLETENTSGQAARASKDTHPLLNESGQVIGKITVFIRLSCFGKMIITEFQVSGDENKSFFFKGTDRTKEPGLTRDLSTISDPYTRDNLLKPGGDASTENVPTTGNGLPPGALQQSGAQRHQPPSPGGLRPSRECAGYPTGMSGHPENLGPHPGGGMLGYPGGTLGYPNVAPTGGPVGSPRFVHDFQQRPQLQNVPEAEPIEELGGQGYKEILMEINGHSLNIKVPRRQKKPSDEPPKIPFCGKVGSSETSSTSSEDDSEPTGPPPQGQLNFCSCDYPLPPGFGAPPPVQKKKKKKQKKPKCPLEQGGDYCLKPNCPMGYPTLPQMNSLAGTFSAAKVMTGVPGGVLTPIPVTPKQDGAVGQKNPKEQVPNVPLGAPPFTMDDTFYLKVCNRNITPNVSRPAKPIQKKVVKEEEETKFVNAETQFDPELSKDDKAAAPKAAGNKPKGKAPPKGKKK